MRRAFAFVVALVAMFAVASSLYAQDDDSAGLVIVTAEGAAQTYCVAVDAEATGWDLLVGAGLAVNSEPSGMGQSICRIDGVGCKSPQESCFCQCQGSPCVYWSYWTQNDAGEWVYSNQGASGARVSAGAVQGWVWGDGTTGKAPAPPSISLGEICAVDGDLVVGTSVASTPVISASVISASVISASVISASVVSTQAVAFSTDAPTVQETDVPSNQNTEIPIQWSLLLVLLPLPIVLGLYLWRRK